MDGPNPIDRNGKNFGNTMRYSFGVSRDSMKKLYVDEILKSPSHTPGPDRYNFEPGFGQQKGQDRYSMRPKNDLFTVHLDKQKKLPGPGFYHDSVDLAGKAQLNSKH